jgi:hypothetical protein
MTHDPPPPLPLDPGRINTMDPVELGHWCEQLRCTMDELEAVIAQVGEHVSAVRAALHGPGSPGR